MENYISKYHRSEPVISFDVNQTLYDVVKSVNENNLNLNYSRFMNSNKTFKDLFNEADKISVALGRDGIKDGDNVGVCLFTVPEVSTSLLGISALGATSNWLDASSSPSDLLNHIVEGNMKALIVSEELVPLVKGIINYTKLERVIVVPSHPTIKTYENVNRDETFIYYNDYINISYDKSDLVHSKYDKEKPTITVQSSGSTGASKTIIHTDYNFNAQVRKMSYVDLPFYKGNRAFVCAPPWVIYGLVNSIYSGLIFGAETVYSLLPKESMLYDNLGLYDYVFGVPVYYSYLYDRMNEFKKSDKIEDVQVYKHMRDALKSVKAFISGGDKITEEDLIKWQLMFDVPIINGYGNNEIVGAGIVSPLYANKPGSIGIPMRDNIVKTFDINEEKVLPDGEIGELIISSDIMFKGYLNKPEETSEIKRVHDGKEWVHTGDLGYVDKDGYVYVKGRIKRLITDKLGYKISPDSSERVIQSSPYVKECVVVGAEMAPKDVVPMAFIELFDEYKGNQDIIEGLKKDCEEKLKAKEVPAFFEEIDAIPHKVNGGKQDFLKREELAKEMVSGNKLVLK